MEMRHLSLSLEEISTIKHCSVRGASYADRISLGFAFQLAQLQRDFGEECAVLNEIEVLEGITRNSVTKPASQFKRPPLHPFWHKHFSTHRHLLRNVCEWWRLGKGGNKRLSAMIEDGAAIYGDQLDLRQKWLAYQFVIGSLQKRTAAKRMTGDWIIFAKHDGQNFYLDLATHKEAEQDPCRLLHKLRPGNACEFPFLFQ